MVWVLKSPKDNITKIITHYEMGVGHESMLYSHYFPSLNNKVKCMRGSSKIDGLFFYQVRYTCFNLLFFSTVGGGDGMIVP